MLLTEKCGNVAVDLSVYDDIDWPDLQIKFELFSEKTFSRMIDAADILTGMSPELRGEYNEVEKLVRLLLVSHASSAEAERNFCALRRPNAGYGSTMTQRLQVTSSKVH
jgi:hypothetical protein